MSANRTKKRVQVQLPLSTYAIVEEIASLGGVAMGSLLAEFITENEEGLKMIRDALVAAKSQDLSGAIDRIQTALLDSVGRGVELTKEMNDCRNALKDQK